ncbi:MAG TPA: RNA 2',3'-cyclic phosphodiesterase [Ignavibacteria bacterium]
MNLIRCFLALNIESSIQAKLKLIQDDVRKLLNNYNVKWENHEKFHLTLRFLGGVNENVLDEIAKKIKLLKFEFENIVMHTKGIGFFPNQKRPNVVFIDLTEEGNHSEQIVSEIDKALDKFGFKPDKKFAPHITIGRFRRENRVKINKEINVKVDPIEIDFDSFYLMKSVLKPKGSVYEVIKRFKFNNSRFPS